MSWFKRKSYPEFWTNYTACFSEKQSQDINELRFVVFDTETTGLNTKTDRILSIGCIAIEGLKIKVADQLESYVNQNIFNTETVKIHGLLKEGKLHKVEEQDATKAFLNYVQNAVLVAHHAAFDVAMINAALHRQGLPKLKNTVLDTGHLFKKLKTENNNTHFGLDDLCERFNIPMHDRHTASGDAYITALLFLKILSKLNAKTLNELKRPHNRVGLL